MPVPTAPLVAGVDEAGRGPLAGPVVAAAVIFVWINLTIADIFSTTNQLTISFDRMPARDLSTSLAWAVYALLLLFQPMGRVLARRSRRSRPHHLAGDLLGRSGPCLDGEQERPDEEPGCHPGLFRISAAGAGACG